MDVQCKQNKSFENNHFYTTILDLQNPKIDGGRPKRSRTDFGAENEGNSCSWSKILPNRWVGNTIPEGWGIATIATFGGQI